MQQLFPVLYTSFIVFISPKKQHYYNLITFKIYRSIY